LRTKKERIDYGRKAEISVNNLLKDNGYNVELRDTATTKKTLNDKLFGDIIVTLNGVKVYIDVKRNGAIPRSSYESYMGDYFAITEKGVLDDPARIHLIPVPVMKSYIETTISKNGWGSLESTDDGVIFTDNNIKGIRAGITLKDWINKNKDNL